MNNSAATIAFFVYLSVVISKGNGDKFMNELESEKPFFKWSIAIFILYTLQDVGGVVTKSLYRLFIISLILSQAPNALKALNEYWSNNNV